MAMIESTLTAVVPAPPERVWELVTDLSRWDWRSDLERIDLGEEGNFSETDKSGVITGFTITKWDIPSRWEFDLENENLTGSWTGLFRAVPEGTEVTLTEVVSPKKTWMLPFVKGFLKKQQNAYLEDLRRALADPDR